MSALRQISQAAFTATQSLYLKSSFQGSSSHFNYNLFGKVLRLLQSSQFETHNQFLGQSRPFCNAVQEEVVNLDEKEEVKHQHFDVKEDFKIQYQDEKSDIFDEHQFSLQQSEQQLRVQENMRLTVRIKNCQYPDDLLNLLQENYDKLNDINIATSAVSVSRMLSRASPSERHAHYNTISEIFAQISALAKRDLPNFQDHVVGNLLWGYGKFADCYGSVDAETNEVFTVLCDRLIGLEVVSGQSLANTLWAIGKLKRDNSEQTKLLINRLLEVDDVTPQGIGNVFWAVGVLRFDDVPTLEKLVNFAKKFVSGLTNQNMAIVMWGLHQAKYRDREFLRMIQDLILSSEVMLDSQAISNVALSFSVLGLEDKENVLYKLVNMFTTGGNHRVQHYANFMFALACMGCPVDLVQAVLDEFNLEYGDKYADIKVINLNQINRARMEYESRGTPLSFPEDLEMRCKRARRSILQNKREQIQSNFRDEVFDLIQTEFEAARKMPLVQDSQILLDVEVMGKDKDNVAVVLLTKSGFFSNEPDEMTDAAIAYNKLLERLGWKVVNVSYAQWDQEEQRELVLQTIYDKLNQ